MALIFKQAPAEVRALSDSEKFLWIKRKYRGGDYVKINIARVRGAYDIRDTHILRVEEAEATKREPLLLTTSQRLGKTWWLIGDGVYVVNDIDVTPADVLALRDHEQAKREAQLRRARLSSA